MAVVLEQQMMDTFGDNVTDVFVEVAETSELCAGY